MCRIVTALVFVLAVVAQSSSLAESQHGVRSTVVVAQPDNLTECAEFDDADHYLLFLGASIAQAIPAIERLEQTAVLQNLTQTHFFDTACPPLYELHAVWLI